MRIGIDARLYNQTGVGRYIKNILFWLYRLDKKNEYFIYVNDQGLSIPKKNDKKWHTRFVKIRWHTFKEQLQMPKILLRDNLDVVHFPYFNIPIFYPKKYLLTIHDLIIDHFDTGKASRLPWFFYQFKRTGYRIAMTRGMQNASKITAISQTTKNEIIQHYHIKPEKIIVTYDALDSNFKKILRTYKPKMRYPFPYILYVGNAYPHKNLEFLLDSFLAIRKIISLKLVLAGDDEYFYPRLENYARDLGIINACIFFGNANDKELIDLYTYTKLLVFPSLMEGFGLPNLEVVSCGKLALASDIPVFREIWKDTLIYFSLNDPNSLARQMLYLLNLSKNQYQLRLLEAKKRLALFNWRKTALETLHVYEKIYRMEKK